MDYIWTVDGPKPQLTIRNLCIYILIARLTISDVRFVMATQRRRSFDSRYSLCVAFIIQLIIKSLIQSHWVIKGMLCLPHKEIKTWLY